MPNVFDSVPVESGNVFDSIPVEQPQTDLSKLGTNPLDVYKLQELKSPNLEDYSLAVPPSLNPNYDFTRATKGFPILAPLAAVGKGLESVQKNVIEPVAAPALKYGEWGFNPLGAELRWRGVLPSIEAGKPMAPLPHLTDAELSGATPAERMAYSFTDPAVRMAESFTTPGNVALLPFAATKPVQALFGAGAAASIPESVNALTEAKTPEEKARAVSSLGLNLGMGALMARGLLHTPAAKALPAERPIMGSELRMPEGAQPPLRVEEFQPLSPETGAPLTTEEFIARRSRRPTPPETPESEVKTFNLDLESEEPNAPQIRQQPESNQPEHTGDAGERTPAQPSGGGSVEQRAAASKPAQANEPVTPSGDVGRIADQEASQITPKAISDLPPEQFFNQAEKWASAAMADKTGQTLNLQRLAEKSAQDNPDLATWQAGLDAATADAKRIQSEIASDPTKMIARQREYVGAGQKRQFFSEGIKAIKKLDADKIQGAAIKVGDKIITGENHVAAYENARSQGVPDTSGATEGFVTKSGKFLNREEAAKSSGVPTTVEPGKLHTEDLSKSPQLVGMGAAKYGETGGPKTPLSELENQIHILAEQPKAGGQKEAFNLGTKIQTFRDGISENLQGLKAAGAYLREKLIGEPKVTDLKRAIGNRHLALTDSAINAREFVKNAEKKITSKLSQEAISDYVDAGGNEEVLRRAAAETKPKYRAGYEAALNLTQDQKTVANNIKQYFDARLDDAIKNGILEDGIEDYLHRYYESDSPWKNGILAELKSGIFTGKPALAKQRVFDYDFEAEKAGLNPVKSFIKRVAAYDLSLNKAIADRNIVKEMSQIKMTDGRPMVDVAGSGVKVGGPVQGQGATLIKPSAKPNSENPIDNRNDYKPFDAPALRKWKWVGTDENGNPVMLQGDVLVHPDAIKDVRALFERSRVRANPVGRVALGASSTVKQTMLDISAFHPVQIAVHGLEHRSNVPFGEYDAKFLGREFRPLTDYINDPQVRGLVRGGMVIGETTGRELFHEGLSGSSLTKHIPGVGPKLAQYSDWLFNDYIPRLKAETGLHALSRNRQRYPNLSEDQLNHLTANQMNAAFGEQNYEMIGRSKTTQDMLRLALLAPDFLESRLKFAGQAATRYGREQLTALMLGAATMYIVARLLNKALDDEYHFEPRNAFSVIKNGKAYSLRTVQGDILQAATDPEKFLRHRLNPLYGRTAMEAITQRDEFGRTRNAQQQLKDFATTIVPISFRGLLNPREQNLMESVLNAVGVTEHRASPTTLVYDLANKYKKEKKVGQEPGEFIYDPDKDPYRPIRQAAIFSTPQTVAKEIARAVKEGKKPEELVKHFQRYAMAPFTGSKKNEPKFFQSLDSDNQKIYQDAKAEKKKILQNFQTGLAIYRRSGGNP